MFCILLAGAAVAGEPAVEPGASAVRHELNLRYRYLALPDFIMDTWYFSKDEGAPYERPSIRSAVYGLEYVLKGQPTNWIFYAEYFGNTTKAGYWDDFDDDGEHGDGDWIAPNGVSMWLLGANFGHEVMLTEPGTQVGFSMLFGAGIGFGLLRGDIDRWMNGSSPDLEGNTCDVASPAYARKDTCAVDQVVKLPPVGGVIDATISGRLNFNHQANLRLDLGLHNMLYVGGALGGEF